MNYIVYGNNYGVKEIMFIGKAKNKNKLREIILNHKNKAFISWIRYGKRIYTVSDIYAGR